MRILVLGVFHLWFTREQKPIKAIMVDKDFYKQASYQKHV